MKQPPHPLTLSHYWCKWFPRYDKMHIWDLKGLTAIAGGSLLYKLVTSMDSLGRNQAERMDAINQRMQTFQRTTGCAHKMPPLRVTDLRHEGWASLSGKLVKAANTRALIPFLNHIAQSFFPAHGAYSSSVRKVFSALDAIEKLLYSSGFFLSDENKTDLNELVSKLGRHWQHLRALARADSDNSWQITTKVHYCMHVPEMSDLINPIFTQNYGEESLIGVVCKIWQKSTRGPYVKSIQKATLDRYWVALEVRMSTYS